MAKTIDARGLSCPQPVLMTMDEIKTGDSDEITIMVDNDASKENVSRAAESRGWSLIDIKEEEGVFTVKIKKG
jgi:TusA-related sulfurtransferase